MPKSNKTPVETVLVPVRKKKRKLRRDPPHLSIPERWKKAIRYIRLGYDLFTVEAETGFSIDELQNNADVQLAMAERNKALLAASADAVVCSAPQHLRTLNSQIDTLSKECERLEIFRRQYSPETPEYGRITKLLSEEREALRALLKEARQIADRASQVVPQARQEDHSGEGLDDFITTLLTKKQASAQQASLHQGATSDDLANDSDDLDEEDE